MFLELIRIIERKKYIRGPTPWPVGWGARPPLLGVPPVSWAPCWPSGFHLLLYEGFYPGKNRGQAYGKKLRRHEAEPWRNQSGGAVLPGKLPSERGKSSPSSSPMILSSGGGSSINIFTSTISSQTLVHLLYPIFVPKPQIGTYGLLVVLITLCS